MGLEGGALGTALPGRGVDEQGSSGALVLFARWRGHPELEFPKLSENSTREGGGRRRKVREEGEGGGGGRRGRAEGGRDEGEVAIL